MASDGDDSPGKRTVSLRLPADPADRPRKSTRKPVAEMIASLQGSSIFPGGAAMLIGYVRVSKSDGTQTLAPQRDAMLAAGVDPARIYEVFAVRPP